MNVDDSHLPLVFPLLPPNDDILVGLAEPTMTPAEFIQKWGGSSLSERSGSQSHFNDLCALLGEPTPSQADSSGAWYTFEKGVPKTGGGKGWADVWKRGCFAWEYKGKRKDLGAAFAQLQRYAIALENPPLLVVSDMETIEIHTNFTNTVEQVHRIRLGDLVQPDTCIILKQVFTAPEKLKPAITRDALTKQAAEAFGILAQRLHQDYNPKRVAHFINKLVFCLFAERIGILPPSVFSHLLEASAREPERFPQRAMALFKAMKDGSDFGSDPIKWFNGGLFEDEDILPLSSTDLHSLVMLSRLDWSAIEPSIFGTLFERGLDPTKRSQIGAYYTDPESILRIVNPVVIEPMTAKWEAAKVEIRDLLHQSKEAKAKPVATRLFNSAKQRQKDFLGDLVSLRVLDPACGSGNFLYLSLLGLKDLELRVMLESQTEFGMEPWFPMVAPESVLGIEINEYAAELARLTIWIGQIQWMLRHGFEIASNPVLKKLDQIVCRDALLNEDGTESEWPNADCIVGNPPFLGDKKMIAGLTEVYVTRLRRVYDGRVPGGADLVTYWFAKAWEQITAGKAEHAGLVATNSIRGGQNRTVLDKITKLGCIYKAWSDEDWFADAIAVRVSLICFSKKPGTSTLDIELDGKVVAEIYSDLTGRTSKGSGVDLTQANPLSENDNIIFMGTTKIGKFDIPGKLAREWLQLPVNPNGRPNSDVVRPWANGKDLTRRYSDTWIIDFGTTMVESEAELYQEPFKYVEKFVKPKRVQNRREVYGEYWWRHGESRPALRKALAPFRRYIATPRVAKHRVFVWLDVSILPDSATFAIAKDDDVAFGILHSRFHRIWSLRKGTSLEDRPRYTPSYGFETFPFPEDLTPKIPAAQYASDSRAVEIAEAAKSLDQLKETWLNPPDLINRIPEVVPAFPDRIVPINDKAAVVLKRRTPICTMRLLRGWCVLIRH